MTRRLFYGIIGLFLFWSVGAWSQTDSLIITGKVDNLTPRLYRQASAVILARVNVLRSSEEIVKVADLQPDGSFAVTLPLNYAHEECRLYFAQLSVPFLASQGAMRLFIQADSIAKGTAAAVRFEGTNQPTNNHLVKIYDIYQQQIGSLRQEIKAKLPGEVWAALAQQRDEQRAVFARLVKAWPTDTMLRQWGQQWLNEDAKGRFCQFLLSKPTLTMPAELADSVQIDTTSLLTYAKADFMTQWAEYAYTHIPNSSKVSLPVPLLSSIFLRYVSNIDSVTRNKLVSFAKGKTATTNDLRWLNGIFEQRLEFLQYIASYELIAQNLAAYFDTKQLDYLKAILYVRSLYAIKLPQLNIWYHHLRSTLKRQEYVHSLDEIYQYENRDSTTIVAAKTTFIPTDGTSMTTTSFEVSPNTTLYKFPEDYEINFFNRLRKSSSDLPTYIVFWSNDPLGRRILADARQWQATLPRMRWVFVADYFSAEETWIEAAIKSRTKGEHVKITDLEVNDYLVQKWGINRVPYCILYDSNGNLLKRDAPLPGDAGGWQKVWPEIERKKGEK